MAVAHRLQHAEEIFALAFLVQLVIAGTRIAPEALLAERATASIGLRLGAHPAAFSQLCVSQKMQKDCAWPNHRELLLLLLLLLLLPLPLQPQVPVAALQEAAPARHHQKLDYHREFLP